MFNLFRNYYESYLDRKERGKDIIESDNLKLELCSDLSKIEANRICGHLESYFRERIYINGIICQATNISINLVNNNFRAKLYLPKTSSLLISDAYYFIFNNELLFAKLLESHEDECDYVYEFEFNTPQLNYDDIYDKQIRKAFNNFSPSQILTNG